MGISRYNLQSNFRSDEVDDTGMLNGHVLPDIFSRTRPCNAQIAKEEFLKVKLVFVFPKKNAWHILKRNS